jgi:hypothetical protein
MYSEPIREVISYDKASSPDRPLHRHARQDTSADPYKVNEYLIQRGNLTSDIAI